MEIILGIIVIAIIAYVLTKKKDVAEVNESVTETVELPAGTEAAVITGANTEAVYIAPEAVAPDAVVEAVVEAPVVTEEVAVDVPAKKKRTKKPAA